MGVPLMASSRYISGQICEATLYGPSPLALVFRAPYPSYGLYVPKNGVAHLNWLHPHRAVVLACDVHFIDSFSKESVATDGGEEIEGFAECCIVQLLLESCQPISVKGDLNGQNNLGSIG